MEERQNMSLYTIDLGMNAKRTLGRQLAHMIAKGPCEKTDVCRFDRSWRIPCMIMSQ